ncbi:MAG: hypothetical protein K2H64_01470, partial [Desulfovibrio sp.]|nr:hypothetical protein [Desulfovibrio sp.]
MKIYRKFSFVYKAPFIKFSLEETNPGEQYAYYIIKNERRLLITPYSDRNWITYDTRYEPGIWRVSYFVKPPDPADWGTTNHYFLNEKRLYFDEKTATLEGEIPADDAPLA